MTKTCCRHDLSEAEILKSARINAGSPQLVCAPEDKAYAELCVDHS